MTPFYISCHVVAFLIISLGLGEVAAKISVGLLLADVFVAAIMITIIRKMARKMYIEECEEIEKSNRQAAVHREKYLQDLNNYKLELNKYEFYKKKQKVVEDCLIAKDRVLLDDAHLAFELSRKYKESEIPDIYRDYVSIEIIFDYLNNHPESDLKTAINYLQAECEKGNVSFDLNYIRQKSFVNK